MATIRDVAKEAKVSVGTVSRYLNGFTLKEDNMKNIASAIEKLKYEENIIAKGLKNNRSLSIGVVINSLTDVFATSIVTAMESYLELNNYSIIICDYQQDIHKLNQKLEFLKTRSIDGVVVFHVEKSLPIFDEYKKAGIPIISIDCPIRDFETDSILVNNEGASYEAVNKLIEYGHKNIGVIAGSQDHYIGIERLKGYKKAMINASLPLAKEHMRTANYTKESGYVEMKNLLLCHKKVTAVYTTNYYMTLGAVQAILEANLRIPEDVSLIGFDYFELSDIFQHKLSVVKQPVEDIGIEAGKLILERIKGNREDFPLIKKLDTELYWRESVQKI